MLGRYPALRQEYSEIGTTGPARALTLAMNRALFVLAGLLFAAAAAAQLAVPGSEPYVGQPGKDVIWVPTPPTLVEKMLDMAAVTPGDYVIDLGSGDGRNVIAAAKRGARALFLLPDNLEQLKPKFERLRPGTRIVTNGYQIAGWDAKEVGVAGGDCAPWCIAYLYVVPATPANRQD